jgi:hypothetical protein
LGFGRGAREEFAGAITFGHAGNHAVHDFLDGKARFRLLFLPVAVIGNAVFLVLMQLHLRPKWTRIAVQ